MPAIPIDDPSDPRIAWFLGLRDRDLRIHDGLFVAESDLVIERALAAGYAPRGALIAGDRPSSLRLPDHVPTFVAGPDVLRRITGLAVHRDSLAAFERRPVASPSVVLGGRSRVIVLDGVMNPTNLGIIARTAAALRWEAMLLSHDSTDPLFRRASRVAMGAVYRLPYAHLERFPGGLSALDGFTVVALDLSTDAEPIERVSFGPDERVALMLGSEGPGISAHARMRCDRLVRIPIAGDVDSLNVAAAAAVACWALR